MRRAPTIKLTSIERAELERSVRLKTVQVRHLLLARIILMAAEGMDNTSIVSVLKTNKNTHCLVPFYSVYFSLISEKYSIREKHETRRQVMPLLTTRYEHIVCDKNGVALIEGTTTKVIELVEERMAYGWSPEEIHFQHPDLSLGQIHSALAYYWDHAEALNQEIERRELLAEKIQQANKTSPFVKRLNAQGLI
jgi:uncharacterized protein (DUF433 family)